MIKIWGRANSINVQKVLWSCDELGMAFERIDAGMQFGVTSTPAFLAINPNGLVPVLEHDGFTLWESHAIVRYLARSNGLGSLCPADPMQAARADQWMDWACATLWPPMKPVFTNLVRVAPPERDLAAVAQGVAGLTAAFRILDSHLAHHNYVAGDAFTMGDIPLAVIAYRWFELDIERTDFSHLKRWYEQITSRPSFKRHCAVKLT